LPFASLLAAADKGRVLPTEARRYLDPSTEFPVDLLTDPAHASVHPHPYVRSIGRRGTFFLFSSDRGGGFQGYRYELRSGEIRQLTDAGALAASTLQILPEDRGFAYVDGRVLRAASFSGLRERDVYRIPDDWELGSGVTVALDGVYAALVENKGTRSRLRLISMAKGTAITMVESEDAILHPIPRPRRASVLYQRDGMLWLVNYDGKNNQRLCPVNTASGAAHWSPDGRNVLYLAGSDRGVVLRERTPDTQQDRIVAPTSQFVNFARNADGSVFVGASGSLGSPYLLILVRAVKRELAIGEHRATDPKTVAPILSPTSQRVYFQSDRHGKPAIHSIVLDKFLEKTETDTDPEKPEPARESKKS
jgi:oligogalacturonide lyase